MLIQSNIGIYSKYSIELKHISELNMLAWKMVIRFLRGGGGHINRYENGQETQNFWTGELTPEQTQK